MTNPLFVSDLATLKAALRMSGVPSTNTDALAILDEAILNARLTFYRRLSKQRVSALVSIVYSANPTTSDEILRALANTTEVKVVFAELLRKLPNQFMDSSGSANRAWNEEAPFRERGSSDAQKEITRLQSEIEEAMQMLAEEESLADESTIQTWDGTPDFIPPTPGDSLRFGGINRRRLSED